MWALGPPSGYFSIQELRCLVPASMKKSNQLELEKRSTLSFINLFNYNNVSLILKWTSVSMHVEHISGAKALSTVLALMNKSSRKMDVLNMFAHVTPIIGDFEANFTNVSFGSTFRIFLNTRVEFVEMSRFRLWEKDEEFSSPVAFWIDSIICSLPRSSYNNQDLRCLVWWQVRACLVLQ